jgi:S-DNA-T family DNA segregation ATPase FtsK/SpoIIIE
VFTPLGGPSIAGLPQVVHVHPSARLGDPAHLIVTLPAGMLLDDLEDRADDLASGLGCWSVRLRMRGTDYVRVDLIDTDPLAGLVPFLPPAPAGHLVWGVDEYGAVVSQPLDELTHIVKQGATRSGKSTSSYSLLAQLAHRARTHGDVEVAGLDPTGLLLGPWGAHPRGWRVVGTDDAPTRYRDALGSLVAEMDRRIAAMPARHDVVPVGPGCPRIVVVLEEWPAVARLTGHSRTKPSEVHRLVARLIAEGAKAAIRVVILVQRAETDFIGAFERDQCETRLSFGCSDANTLKLLHDGVTNDTAALHATSPKGVALAQLPGRDLVRIRAPWIGGYGAYCDAVAPPADPTAGRLVVAA